MENKMKKLLQLMMTIFLATNLLIGLAAQENDDENQAPQWQTLEWDEEFPEYVTKYQIEIEAFNLDTHTFTPLQSVTTHDNTTSIKIEPQLTAGIYRYKIISYDLLELPSSESEWNSLVIHKAYQPEIKSVSSAVNFSSKIYLEEYNDGVFTISGKNLFMPPENQTVISFTRYFLKKRNKKNQNDIIPLIIDHDEDNKKIKIKFTEEQMDVGEYDLVAIDASGLESAKNSDSNITIKFKKLMDLDISAGYTLPYMIFDETLPYYMDAKIWPLSAATKITFIPLKKRWGYLGVGLEGAYTRMSADYSTYKVAGNMATGHLNFVYQKPIYKTLQNKQRKHIMTLEAHAGAGFVYLLDYVYTFPHNIQSKPLNSLNISADAGLAAQYYFTSRLYAELEANFVMAFGKDITMGTIYPALSVGWQF